MDRLPVRTLWCSPSGLHVQAGNGKPPPQSALDKVAPRFGGVLEILAAGKGHVIFSPLNLTSGLLGTNTWGVWGYAPNYAQSFLQNAIFCTVDGQRENAVAPE